MHRCSMYVNPRSPSDGARHPAPVVEFPPLIRLIAASTPLFLLLAGFGPAPVQAAQHPVHLHRRPCLPGRRRLRLQDQPDPQHRPDRPRGNAVRPGAGHQFHLRPEPGRDPHRPVQPPQRRPGQPPAVRRHPADLSQALAGGRVPDGCLREVASEIGPHRLRRLGSAAGPGRLLQPGHAGRAGRQAPPAYGLHHGHRHGSLAGVAQESQSEPALPAHEPAQGAAPPLDARTGPLDAL